MDDTYIGITLQDFFFFLNFKCFRRTAHSGRTSSPLKAKQDVAICNASALGGISQQQLSSHPPISCSSRVPSRAAAGEGQGLFLLGSGGLWWANTGHTASSSSNRKHEKKAETSQQAAAEQLFPHHKTSFFWSPGLLLGSEEQLVQPSVSDVDGAVTASLLSTYLALAHQTL